MYGRYSTYGGRGSRVSDLPVNICLMDTTIISTIVDMSESSLYVCILRYSAVYIVVECRASYITRYIPAIASSAEAARHF